jgi:hypothetical protein
MSYAQFASIDASDFNTLVGGNPTTTSGTLNAVWATGGGAFGYGQTALANVTVGQTVAACHRSNVGSGSGKVRLQAGGAAAAPAQQQAGGHAP